MSHRERMRRREFYYREAQKVGYRSRASFKLLQLDEKYSLFKPGDLVLDVGAAPGGWSQVAIKGVSPRGKVYAIDLEFMEPIDGVITLQGDITEEKTHERLIKLIGEPVDTIISDLSPKVSGNWSTDHARQIYLSEQVLRMCTTDILKQGGKFVCKLFQGDLFEDFIENMKIMFQVVYLFKPKASRKASAEIYAVAKGLKQGPIKAKSKSSVEGESDD